MSKTTKGDSLDCAQRDLSFECDTILLFLTSWSNSCIVDASGGSDGLLFCLSVSRLSTKRGEAMKQNIVGMGHGPCRLNAEYCIDISHSELVSLWDNKVALSFNRKKCFCNNMVYSLADAIVHNLIFPQGVPCDLEIYAVQYETIILT